jgi:CheY-like chemotaxis protein
MLPQGVKMATLDGNSQPRQLSVLIVDDFADPAEALALLVQLLGHHASVAQDPEAAVRAVQERPPDMVITGVRLAGDDGYALAKRLRSLMSQKPLLVALTTYAEEPFRQRSREEGFDYHFVKPLAPETMVDLLGFISNRPPGSDRLGESP